MELNLSVTHAACDYIKTMLEKNPGKAFRLSIKKTGCSGYSYYPSLIESINPADKKIEPAEGLTIYIDTAWLDLLQGMQMDYIEENFSGLKQNRLVFTNPNESSRCGCGKSFHVGD